jgi:hypothetical protein
MDFVYVLRLNQSCLYNVFVHNFSRNLGLWLVKFEMWEYVLLLSSVNECLMQCKLWINCGTSEKDHFTIMK